MVNLIERILRDLTERGKYARYFLMWSLIQVITATSASHSERIIHVMPDIFEIQLAQLLTSENERES